MGPTAARAGLHPHVHDVVALVSGLSGLPHGGLMCQRGSGGEAAARKWAGVRPKWRLNAWEKAKGEP